MFYTLIEHSVWNNLCCLVLGWANMWLEYARFRVRLAGGVEKWEDRKDFIFSHFFLGYDFYFYKKFG